MCFFLLRRSVLFYVFVVFDFSFSRVVLLFCATETGFPVAVRRGADVVVVVILIARAKKLGNNPVTTWQQPLRRS